MKITDATMQQYIEATAAAVAIAMEGPINDPAYIHKESKAAAVRVEALGGGNEPEKPKNPENTIEWYTKRQVVMLMDATASYVKGSESTSGALLEMSKEDKDYFESTMFNATIGGVLDTLRDRGVIIPQRISGIPAPKQEG